MFWRQEILDLSLSLSLTKFFFFPPFFSGFLLISFLLYTLLLCFYVLFMFWVSTRVSDKCIFHVYFVMHVRVSVFWLLSLNFCVTAELPSHMVLGMPALSPTMVRYMGKELILKHLLFFLWLDLLFFAQKLGCILVCSLVQTQGNIAKWRKKEGDKVSYIQKVDMMWEFKAS